MRSKLLTLSLPFLLVACSTIQHDFAENNVRNMEYQLQAAGFKILLADTQEKQNLLNGLPAGTLSRLKMGGTVYFMYPDRVACSCIYVGRQEEANHLQRLGAEMQQENQALLIHEMGENEQAQWGPAGPYGNYGLWPLSNPNGMGRPGWDPS